MEPSWRGACRDLSLWVTLQSPGPQPKPTASESPVMEICEGWGKWFLIVALIGVSLLTGDVERHVVSLLAAEFFLESLQVFCSFSIGLFVFLLTC